MCKDEVRVCTVCGQELYEDDYMYNVDGEDYCECCYDEEFTVCDVCGELIANDYIEEYSIYGEPHAMMVCENCRDYYYYCENCGVLISEDDYRRGRYDNVLCPDCHSDEDLDFDWKPDVRFFKQDDEVAQDYGYRYFGVEIETDDVECPNDMIGWVRNYEPLVTNFNRVLYATEDGSLSDSGIEFVSQAMTLATHKAIDYDGFFRRLDYSNAAEYKRGVGLHVHVNRLSLGVNDSERDFTVAKLLLMVEPLWEKYFVPVGRRLNADTCQWCKKNAPLQLPKTNKRDLNVWELAKAYAYATGGYADRYQAINTNNSATVEFRFFQNAVETSDVLGAIEVVDALIEYARNHTINQCQNVTPYLLHRDNKPSELLLDYYKRVSVDICRK